MLSKIRSHAQRVRHHLGSEVSFGNQRFKVHGYYANRLNISERHERNLTEVFTRQLQSRPGAFIDVGVNIGQTLCKVLGADRSRRYIGFEPQIGCCFFVDQFLRLNNLENASILPIALSDANGTFTLYSGGAYDEMASLVGAQSGTGMSRPHATRVTARVGDEVLGELGIEDICAIKIDVEGAERQVLAGLEATMRAKRPPIFFEVLPNFHGNERIRVAEDLAVNNRAEADAIYSFLDRLGYGVAQIDEHAREKPIARFDLDDREHYVSFNYVARAAR